MDLSLNDFVGTLAVYHPLRNLTSLNVSGNALSGEGFIGLQFLTALRYGHTFWSRQVLGRGGLFVGTTVTLIAAAVALTSSPPVRVLDLSYNQFSDELPASVAVLTSLS